MIDEKTYETIERIANEHSHKVFGYLNQDDLKNEIWVICLEKLEKYDYSRGPLEHFLRSSVKNRLINRFKDITKSVRSPCGRCPYFKKEADSECSEFGHEKLNCKKWHNYQLSVDSRNSLLNASEQKLDRSTDDRALDKMAASELRKMVEGKIGKLYERDLNQLVSGGKISKQRLKRLKKEINRVLEEQPPEPLVQIQIKGKENG